MRRLDRLETGILNLAKSIAGAGAMIELAHVDDFPHIAELNVTAYAEFSSGLAPGSWEIMRGNLQDISDGPLAREIFIVREAGKIIGSVAYCPPGKADPHIFSSDMAAVLLLAVYPDHRGKGVAKALTQACITKAR